MDVDEEKEAPLSRTESQEDSQTAENEEKEKGGVSRFLFPLSSSNFGTAANEDKQKLDYSLLENPEVDSLSEVRGLFMLSCELPNPRASSSVSRTDIIRRQRKLALRWKSLRQI